MIKDMFTISSVFLSLNIDIYLKCHLNVHCKTFLTILIIVCPAKKYFGSSFETDIISKSRFC